MPRLVDLQKASHSNAFNGDAQPIHGQDDEILVADARNAIRPTEFVERKLQVAMQRPQMWDIDLQS